MDKQELFACAAALILVLVPGSVWAQTGTIIGTVTDASTGAPIPNIAVEIYTTPPPPQPKPPQEYLVTRVVTDSNGAYQVSGLSDGFYRAGTTLSGRYAVQRFNNVECVRVCSPGSGTTFSVAGSAPASAIDFALYPTGAADLVAAFGPDYGLWMLAADGRWQQLHWLSPRAMTTGDLDGNHQDDLIVDFGPDVGLYAWMNHHQWRFIHGASPTQMVAADLDRNGHDDLVVVFPGYGVWRWVDTGAWSQLHPFDASKLAVGRSDGRGADLIRDFPGFGLWIYQSDGTWRSIHPQNVTTLLAADVIDSAVGNIPIYGRYDVIASFAGAGLWAYLDGSFWQRFHQVTPRHTGAGYLLGGHSADLVVDFGEPYGLWTYRGALGWSQIHQTAARRTVLADRTGNAVDEIMIDFGPPSGLWQLANHHAAAWSQLHALSPETLVVGQFH